MALSKLRQSLQGGCDGPLGSPHHHGKLEDAEQVVLNNPTCGDVISLSVRSLMLKIRLKILPL